MKKQELFEVVKWGPQSRKYCRCLNVITNQNNESFPQVNGDQELILTLDIVWNIVEIMQYTIQTDSVTFTPTISFLNIESILRLYLYILNPWWKKRFTIPTNANVIERATKLNNLSSPIKIISTNRPPLPHSYVGWPLGGFQKEFLRNHGNTLLWLACSNPRGYVAQVVN